MTPQFLATVGILTVPFALDSSRVASSSHVANGNNNTTRKRYGEKSFLFPPKRSKYDQRSLLFT